MARTPFQRARQPRLSVAARAVAVAVLPAAFTVCAAAAAPATAASTPPTVRTANDGAGSVDVSPRRVRAGAEVRLRVAFCGAERRAMATSVAFDADVDLRRTADGTAFHGTAHVSSHTPPGSYGLTVVCGTRTRDAQGSFHVVGPGPAAHGDRGAGTHTGRDGRHEPPPRHPSPVAPVRAGGGGTADTGAATDAEPAHHAGLVTAGSAAVAGAAIWVTRRLRNGTGPG